MKALYVRISTPNQKVDRQLKKDKTIKAYIDVCSGGVLFKDRPEASKLMKNSKITSIEVKEISRLGRNLKDILNTIEYFTNKGIDIRIENLGLNLMVDGKLSAYGQLMVSMFGAIAEHERSIINERTQEGREIAKVNGVYKGRKRGASSDLMKKNYTLITAVQSDLDKGISISKIAEMHSISRPRIYSYIKKGLLTVAIKETAEDKNETGKAKLMAYYTQRDNDLMRGER
ncbi:Site-specific DNA recombinase [Formosa sp. Hel1_31_208]|uniref:recombinase family protein n=1 Tax=Formosa sp. Hel1_31_208 TaxID=1798225 RepID=UPI00087BCFEC|nr:recombinase family protein [Formosa sp. Hel1_31_208]SDS49636.1 Site-specific DNA recombinase [Formosa sp. Hel1_31_208]